MLQFHCTSCQAKLQADEEHAGMEIACPECGTAATVPPSPGAITSATPGTSPIPSTAVTTPELANSGPTFDSERRRDREPASSAATKGMGAGMIVLIILGVGGCAMLIVVGVLAALLIPAVQKVRQAAALTQTQNNMKMIGLACHNYHDVYKHFPPPRMGAGGVMPDGKARPVALSWRVAILPYLEQDAMFGAFDTKADWDDPKNAGFLNKRPKIYDSPWKPTAAPNQTPFQVFVGPNTMFPDLDARPRIADVTDGSSNTILFAEAQTPVPWSKPADMEFGKQVGTLVPADRVLVGMVDGTVRIIDRRQANDEFLRMLIDPRDDKQLPRGIID